MSKQLEWDVYRYVLDDPTQDRAAFEALMLEDMNLALAVAEAVRHVDLLRAASFVAPAPLVSAASGCLPRTEPSPSMHRSAVANGWRLSSLAILAASFMLAIGWLNLQLSHQRNLGYEAANKNLADSWLAMLETELVDGSSNLVDVSTNSEPARDDDLLSETADFVVSESSTEDDWLMDAAREFYAQKEAS